VNSRVPLLHFKNDIIYLTHFFIHFRIKMYVYSDTVKEMKNDAAMTDFELEVKIEKRDEKGDIKTEVFEENNSASFQIIGEKRKNTERSYLENENKKIKEEFVIFEELDYKLESQEIVEINLGVLNNQVIKGVFEGKYLENYTLRNLIV
jgi:hypothetical protein